MTAPDDADVQSSLAHAHQSLDEADGIMEQLRLLLHDAQAAVTTALTAVTPQEVPRDRE